MINWNDIHVEKKIAQERYEVIVRGRHLDRSRQQTIRSDSKTGHYVRFRNWLGEQLMNWGCQVKTHCQAA